MTEIQVGDQIIRYDRAATAAAYAALEHGFAEECGCLSCRNFAARRNQVYPASFRALLEQLGVDPAKEAEAFEEGPADDGCQFYGGWFYLVGEMVIGGERNCAAADSHHFDFFFTSAVPRAQAFGDGPMLAVEFTTHIQWDPTENRTGDLASTQPALCTGP